MFSVGSTFLAASLVPLVIPRPHRCIASLHRLDSDRYYMYRSLDDGCFRNGSRSVGMLCAERTETEDSKVEVTDQRLLPVEIVSLWTSSDRAVMSRITFDSVGKMSCICVRKNGLPGRPHKCRFSFSGWRAVSSQLLCELQISLVTRPSYKTSYR